MTNVELNNNAENALNSMYVNMGKMLYLGKCFEYNVDQAYVDGVTYDESKDIQGIYSAIDEVEATFGPIDSNIHGDTTPYINVEAADMITFYNEEMQRIGHDFKFAAIEISIVRHLDGLSEMNVNTIDSIFNGDKTSDPLSEQNEVILAKAKQIYIVDRVKGVNWMLSKLSLDAKDRPKFKESIRDKVNKIKEEVMEDVKETFEEKFKGEDKESTSNDKGNESKGESKEETKNKSEKKSNKSSGSSDEYKYAKIAGGVILGVAALFGAKALYDNYSGDDTITVIDDFFSW